MITALLGRILCGFGLHRWKLVYVVKYVNGFTQFGPGADEDEFHAVGIYRCSRCGIPK